MNRKLLGEKGEELACVLLKTRGYEIIARNYITKIGEIDIIALKDRVVRKQNKIKRCAEMFLLSTGIAYDYCEFHVIEITAEHLKNCF